MNLMLIIKKLGNLAEYWTYRVGDYRLLIMFENDQLVIIVAELTHQRHAYIPITLEYAVFFNRHPRMLLAGIYKILDSR